MSTQHICAFKEDTIKKDFDLYLIMMDDEKIKRFVILLFFTFLESSTCLPVFNETNEDIDNAKGENSSLGENYTCMALHKCDHYSKLFDDIMSETQRENVLQFYNRISCEFEDLPEDDLETSIYKGKICCFLFFLNTDFVLSRHYIYFL